MKRAEPRWRAAEPGRALHWQPSRAGRDDTNIRLSGSCRNGRRRDAPPLRRRETALFYPRLH